MSVSAPQMQSVLVLGARMSGILAGIRLRQEGIRDFEMLEMAGDVGGTWRDNTYPGLSCDVPAHSCDYSFESNWRWKSTYAEAQRSTPTSNIAPKNTA